MIYRLHVKGSPFQVARECADRGFAAAFVYELDGVTSVDVNVESRGRLASWFAEPPNNPPFPAGSLLFYSALEADQEAS